MATVSNTPRPGYVWDSTDNVWYPIGTGPHTHADYITSGSAINPNIVDAKGDIIAATAADTVARLAVGSNNQVLTADSSTATGLKWATPAAGGITLISETTASALTSLSLTSIPGTYKQLLLVWIGLKHSNNSSEFNIRLNNDSTFHYGHSYFSKNGGTTGSSIGVDDRLLPSNFAAFGIGANVDGTEPHKTGRGFLRIDNYASTTKEKFFEGKTSFINDPAGDFIQRIAFFQGIYPSTSAITSIDVFRTGGTATFSNHGNTSIRLYGIS